MCPICCGSQAAEAYPYLLGLYLGDGCLTRSKKGVFRLEIAMDARYPRILDECRGAIAEVHVSGKVNAQSYGSWMLVYSYWKHWPCIFPQHGSGSKINREIKLRDWQLSLIRGHEELLLKGLIHSDGCRSINRVNGREYPRYYFSNYSEDIRNIFCSACDACGIRWKQMNWRTISVARRSDVERLDAVIGPKK